MSGAEVEDTCWWREPLRDGVVDVPGAMSQKDSSWLCVCARVQARPMSWKVSLPGSVPHIIMCVCVCADCVDAHTVTVTEEGVLWSWSKEASHFGEQ